MSPGLEGKDKKKITTFQRLEVFKKVIIYIEKLIN